MARRHESRPFSKVGLSLTNKNKHKAAWGWYKAGLEPVGVSFERGLGLLQMMSPGVAPEYTGIKGHAPAP